jgi:hypothetical protein
LAKEAEKHDFEMEQLEKEKQGLMDALQTKTTALKESANEYARLNVTIKGLQEGDFKAKIAELHKTVAKLEKELEDAKVPPVKSTFDLLDPKSPVFEDEIVHLIGEVNKRLLEFFNKWMGFKKGRANAKWEEKFFDLRWFWKEREEGYSGCGDEGAEVEVERALEVREGYAGRACIDIHEYLVWAFG